MRNILVLLFGFVLFSSPTFAQDAPDGSALLHECQIVVDHADGKMQPNEFIQAGHCLGYLNGARDTYRIWDLFNVKIKGNNPAPVCFPEGVTVQELAMVVVKYLKDHPTKMHERYHWVVLMAFGDAYPCKAS